MTILQIFIEEQQHIYISRFKTSSLGNAFSSFEKQAFKCDRCWRNAKILQSHMAVGQYLVSTNTDFSTISETGISSVDTWYLLWPST